MKQTAHSAIFFAILGGVLILGGCTGDKGSGGGTTAGGTTTGGTAGTTGGGGTTAKLEPNDAQNPDPKMIQIGLVASLNGALKPWGMDSQSGALLAVDEINKAGGIGGKKVQLLIEDSNSTPEQGKTAAERLISKGAVALVGEVASGITAQIANAAKDKKIPVVAVGATKTDLPGIGDWVARVCYTDDLQGPVMANFAYFDKGLRNVAVVTDDKQPYSQYLSKTFSDTFKKLGGTIVDEQFYESGNTQFSGLLTNVKAKNPDGVFLSGYFTEVGPLVRQAVDAGIKAVFMGGDGWDSSEILTSGGDAIVGSYFCNHYNNKEDRPEVKTFLDKWKAVYGDVPGTTMGALGYDAVGVVIAAMKAAKDPKSSAEVLAGIQNTDNFPGVSGKITLKGMHGNPDKRALVVKLTNDPKQPQVFEKAYEVKDVKK